MKEKTSTKKLNFGVFGNLLRWAILFVVLAAFGVTSQAQNASFPFPNNYKYTYGIEPTNSSSSTIQTLYNEWLATYYVEGTIGSTACARIKFLQPGTDGSSTVSEGIGYGMLIMVYMDNSSNLTQSKFNKLWAYYQANEDANGLMNWETTGFTGSATLTGAATDADIDVCQALVMADKQWGSTGTVNYLSAAQALMHKIYQYEVYSYSGTMLLGPGDMFHAWLNPSYFIINAVDLFAAVGTSGDGWSTVATNTYSLLTKIANGTSGLVPDWCDNAGNLIKSGTGLGDACATAADAEGIGCQKFESYFLYDAIRVPWRMAQAYAWYGDATAATIATNIAKWVSTTYSNDPSQTVDGYNLNGTSLNGSLESPFNTKGTYHNACFTGGLGISAMASSTYQTLLNNAWSTGSVDPGANGAYFICTTQILYLLCMSGNMPNFTNMNPAPVSLYNSSTGGCGTIYVQFNKPMSSTSVAASTTGWTVTKNNTGTPVTVPVSSVALGSDGKTVALTLNGTTDEPIPLVSYSGSPTLSSADGKTVSPFTKDTVKDVLKCARAYPLSAATDILADTIKIAFSKAMLASSYTLANFSVSVGGTATTITKITSSTTDPTLVELLITPGTITSNATTISVTYTPGTLESQDGGYPVAFTMSVINNYLTQTCLTIDALTGTPTLTWATWTGGTWLGTATNPSGGGEVGEFTKGTAAANQYVEVHGELPKATTSDSTLNARLQTNPVFKINVYSPKAGNYVRIRLQDRYLGGSAYTTAIQCQAKVATAESWTTLSFDLTSQLAALPHVNELSVTVGPDSVLTTAESIYITDVQLCPPPATTNLVRGITSFDGTQIKVLFSTAMAVPTALTGFTIYGGTTASPVTETITAVTIDPINKDELDFTLATALLNTDVVQISYSGNTAKGLDGLPVVAFTKQPVVNLVGRAVALGWKDNFNISATTNPSESTTINIGGVVATIPTSGNGYAAKEVTTGIGFYDVKGYGGGSTAGDYISFGPSVAGASAAEVWDLTSDPNVRFSVAVPSGEGPVWVRADLVDLVNTRSTDGGSTFDVQLTCDGTQHTYTIPFAGKFVNQYSSSPGPVDQTNIVACNLYLWTNSGTGSGTTGTPTLWKTDSAKFDYISVGTTIQITNSPTLNTNVAIGKTFSATASIAGTFYLVPNGTPRIYTSIVDSVNNSRGTATTIAANTATTISTTGLAAGYYIMYAYNPVTGEVSRHGDGINIVDVTPPIITQASSGNFQAGQAITVTVNKAATAYLVPSGTAGSASSIKAASIANVYVSANTPGTIVIPTSVTVGQSFVFYAIDNSGNVSTASSSPAIVIVDVTPPIISNYTTDTVAKETGTVVATLNEAGTVYLVASSNVSSVTGSATAKSYAVASAAATAGNQISPISLTSITTGSYVLYAIDAYGNLAGPTTPPIIVVLGCTSLTGVTISPTSLTLTEGQAATSITYTVAPTTAPTSSVASKTWQLDGSVQSGYYTIGTTNGAGVIVVNSDGSVSITAPTVGTLQFGATTDQLDLSITDCSGKVVTSTITITTNPGFVCPTKITLSPTTVSEQVGAKGTLAATLTGGSGTYTYVWSSASNTIATVSSNAANCTVTGVSVGTTTVTSSVSNCTVSATAVITITKIPVTSVTVTPSPSVSIVIGATSQATGGVLPTNATNTGITWSSSNTAIATVNSSGLISAIGVGTATITATSSDNSAATATIAVTVTPIHVTSVTLAASPTSINVGATTTITPTIAPTNATVQTVTWTTSDATIATVSSGVVTGVKAGTVTITATSVQDPTIKGTITITVTNVAVTAITVSGTMTMTVGGTQTLATTVTPSNATSAALTWSTSSSTVATVSSAGVVTAIAAGTVTITATSVQNPGVSGSFTITVSNILPTSVAISGTLSVNVGSTTVLTATITPSNAADQTVTWSSSNTAVATVDATGKVTGVAAGTASITATSNAVSSVKASATVTVSTVAVTGVSVTGTSTMTVGGTQSLTATVTPTNATNASLTWSTSSSTVATVSSSGVVTAIASGTVTITATSVSNTGVSGTYTIVVSNILPTSVSISGTLSVNVGASTVLTATITPSNAADQTVTWSSSNTAVATVDATGKVTGVAAGTVSITATSNAVSSVKASATVTVSTVAVTGVSVTGTSTMTVGGTQSLTATVTPTNATNASLTWSTSSSTVATVSSSGVVTAIASGTVTITATSVSNTGISGTYTIVVSNVMPTSVTISGTLSVNVGASTVLTATILPSNAGDKTVTWSSSNTAVATVDATGKVTGVAAGTVSITATSNAASVVNTSATVTVSAVAVTGIAISGTPTMTVGGTQGLSVTVTPSNATNSSVTWSSSATGVATVNSSGVVTAVTSGTVTITATSVSNTGVSGTYTIVISNILPTSVAISGTLSVNVGSTTVLTATITPSNAADQTVTWSSSNTAVATVDATGKVTGVAAGTASITATSNAVSTVKASATVTVSTVAVTGVSVTGTSTMTVGGTQSLTATVTPTNATNASLTWSTSSSTVATVSASGIVTAIAAGTVTITATSVSNTGVSGTYTIVVSNIMPTSVAISGTLSVNVGSTTVLTATITPSNAADQTVTWSSSNAAVATVDNTGKVTGVAAGTVSITATSNAVSTVKASATVNVTNVLVSGITVTPATTTLTIGQATQLSASVTPTNATLKTYTWSSSNTAIATVDANGNVSAKAQGTVTITATANDASGTKGTSIVTVNPVMPVSISASDISLLTTDVSGKTITYTISPDSTTNQNVTFTVANSGIATVNTSGLVVPVAEGTTTITITSVADASVKTVINVTVTSTVYDITSVTVDSSTVTLSPGGSQTISTTLNPTNASVTSIVWTSSNSSVATVDQNGVIKAIAVGTATITVTVATPNATQSATVTVIVATIPVASITLAPTTLALNLSSLPTSIVATVLPVTATNTSVAWASSNTGVVSVSSAGVVTVVGLGTASVTCTAKDGSGVSAACAVTVSNVDPTSLTIDSSSVMLNVGDKVTLTASLLPSDAPQVVNWTIANTSIASIDANGVVTAIAAGSTTITATSQAKNTVSQTINIVVKTVPVTKIVLSSTSLSLTLASPATTLTATVNPTNATSSNVTWTSSNTAVVTVTNGVVTVVGLGTATITCAASDGSGISATCAVTVTNVAPTSVKISATTEIMNVGDKVSITATVAPSTAPQAITWTSSNTAVATVDANGTITALAAGTTTISATSQADNLIASSIPVTVNDVLVNGITLNPISLSLTLASTAQTITATIAPSNATNSTVTWTSSNPAVVSVTNGVVTVAGLGTATITCASTDGSNVKATCAVTVTNVAPSSVSITQTSETMNVGDNATVSATVSPSNAPQGVNWTIANTSIATIDVNGTITALAAGTTTIIATSQADNSKIASIPLTVNAVLITGITLNPTNLPLTLISSATTISATIAPTNATNAVTWTSSNTSVVAVSNGVVTVVGLGTATITCAASDGSGIKATCSVTVTNAPPTSVTISPTSETINVGGKVTVTASVLPAKAIQTVLWSIANTNYATINANGTITGIAAGSTTITVKSTADNTVLATISLTVNTVPVSGISLNPPSLTLTLASSATTIVATVAPTNATNATVAWTSSDPTIVTVTAGIVTVVGLGNATITCSATDGSGISTICAVTVTNVAPASITLTSNSVNLTVGGTQTVSASILPIDAPQNVLWTTSNNAIATVNSNGTITAMGVGTATITASSQADASIKSTVTVVVSKIAVTGVTVDKSSVTMQVGASATVTPTVSPSNATDTAVTWTSSNAAIATVSNGYITGIAIGTTTVTVASADDATKKAIVSVTVTKIPVTSLTVDQYVVTVNDKGSTAIITPTIKPSGASNKTVNWTSADTAIATVSSNGVITGVKQGSTTVTATSADNSAISQIITVTVTHVTTVINVTSVSLDSSSMTLQVGDSATLSATVSPINATVNTVTFSSSDPTVATVNASNGYITAVAAGTTSIKVETTDGGFVASCTLTVIPVQVKSISFTQTSYDLDVNSSLNLYSLIQFNPTNAADTTISWVENNIKIASLDVSSGILKPSSTGTETITATTSNSKTATITVNITTNVVAATGLILSPSSLVFTFTQHSIGFQDTLTAIVSPSNATSKAISYTTTDASVIQVDSVTGIVTVVDDAKINTPETIYASTVNGMKATCAVQIYYRYVVDSLLITTLPVTIDTNSTLNLQSVIYPSQAAITNSVVWTIDSTTSIGAKVTKAGVLTAGSSNGVVYAKATVVDVVNNTQFTKQLMITVKQVVPLQSISVSVGGSTSVSVQKGYTKQIVVNYSPTNADNGQKGVTYYSTDPAKATVDSNGVITGVLGGVDTIYVIPSVNPSLRKAIVVTVVEFVQSISIAYNFGNQHNIFVHDSAYVYATISPSTATNNKIIVQVSDSTIASVREISNIEWLVTGLSDGTIAIVAYATDNSGVESNQLPLQVSIKHVSSVSVASGVKTVDMDSSLQLQVIVNPSNATDQTVTWTSSNANVLTVDANGLITPVGIGSAIVTITSNDNPNITDTLTINVIRKPLEVSKLETDIQNAYNLYISKFSAGKITPSILTSLFNAHNAASTLDGKVTTGSDASVTQAQVNSADSTLLVAMANVSCNCITAVESVASDDISIYPIPVTDILQVKGVSVISINVIDMLGKNVAQSQGVPVVDMSNVPSGVYRAVIKSEKGVSIKAVVKQ